MQLKQGKSIRGALTTLTVALVGSTAVHAAGANRTETSLLIYSERDRMRATEANFNLSKQLRHAIRLDLHLTYDGLTGATPTGASPSKYPQTITRASGGTTVTVPAGEFPRDDSFRDTRFAGSVNLGRPLSRTSDATIGLYVSSEHDYTSIGFSGSLTQDLNRRNTTLGLAVSASRDVVKPAGGFYDPRTPVGTEPQQQGDGRLDRFAGRVKRVYDFVLSLTQVLDRRTIVRANGSFGRSSGYLTDPYKVISMVQPPDSVEAGEPIESYYENRPDSRARGAVFAEMRRMIHGAGLNLSYRFYWDDWGVTSHEGDLGVLMDFGSTGAFQPHVRYYRQTRADFYRVFMVEGQPLPAYASADSRLADFHAITSGLTWTVPVNATSKLRLTGEYYLQRGDVSPPTGYGSRPAYDLFPTLDVVMLRAGYIHEF